MKKTVRTGANLVLECAIQRGNVLDLGGPLLWFATEAEKHMNLEKKDNNDRPRTLKRKTKMTGHTLEKRHKISIVEGRDEERVRVFRIVERILPRSTNDK